MNLKYCLLLAVLLCGVGNLSGCSGGATDKWTEGRPKTYNVNGTVTFQGSPLAGATVVFRSAEHQVSASGVTNADGKFRLTTYEDNDGAVAGEHDVIVQKYDEASLPANVDLDETSISVEPKLVTPAKYADFEKSGLRQSVATSGANEFRLELQE